MRVRKLLVFMPPVVAALLCAARPVAAAEPPFERCGTPRVLELMAKGVGKITSSRMDQLANSVVSPSGHFRVHYDSRGYNAPDPTDADFKGIPDYIDSTLAYLDYVWNLEVGILGYPPPYGDRGAGGGDEIDVYIINFGGGEYGVTYPDQMSDGSSSAYFFLDNNYMESQYSSKGYAALRVSTAHEFFHTIQFAYVMNMNLIWWMEQSATWMEDRAWDDVNDYLVYLKYFFPSYRDYPLDYPDGNFKYGAVVWPMYLAERFGDNQIRRIWEAIAVVKTSGIAIFDTVIPGGLSAALNEFGVWNYFTKDRANPASFYRDGAMFKYMVGVDLQEGVEAVRDSLPTRYLTSNYIEFLFVDGWDGNDALSIEYTTAPGRVHANSLVFFNSPTDFRIHPIDRPGTSVALGRRWNRAVLVTTCVNTVPANGAFSFTAYHEDVLAVKRESPEALTFTGTFPNPFNTAVSIRFTLPDDGRVSVRAYDILGRKAADLFDGDLAAGEKDVLWKPENLSGGVYLVHIATPYGSHTTKVLLLK